MNQKKEKGKIHIINQQPLLITESSRSRKHKKEVSLLSGVHRSLKRIGK